jgi:iron(III) transport system substrate-binding protein
MTARFVRPCRVRAQIVRRALALVSALACALLSGCGDSRRDAAVVVVYTSVDAVFSRLIAESFTEETAIEVRLVPDTEETKSTGLLNRLIAEKGRPVADVF